MEKIKLKNSIELEIIPNGIITFEKSRIFKLISSLTYPKLEELFESSDNISNIQYLSESSEVLATYLDCVRMKSLSKEKNVVITDSLTADVYTVELSTDLIERAIEISKEERKVTADALEELIFIVMEG